MRRGKINDQNVLPIYIINHSVNGDLVISSNVAAYKCDYI